MTDPMVPGPPAPVRRAAPTRSLPPSAGRRWIGGPPQGWTSLLALVVMLAASGLAVGSVRLTGVNGDATVLSSLSLVAVAAGLVGALLARTRLGVVLPHVVGAAIGAIVVIVVVAGVIGDAADPLTRMRALHGELAAYIRDVALGTPAKGLPMLLLVLGAILWTTGQSSASSVFRYSRGGPAIVASGVLVLASLALDGGVPLVYLVVFAAASLLLLVRLNLTRQRQAWQRRHVADGGEVSRLFLRTGAAFAGLVLVGATSLAAVAVFAPLADSWSGLRDTMVELSLGLERIVGGIGIPTPRPGSLFAPRQTISGVWDDSSAVDFIAAADDRQGHYWRGATYNEFDGRTWWQLARHTTGTAEGAPLLEGSADGFDLTSGARREVTATVSSVGLVGTTLLAPAVPDVTDRPTDVRTSGVNGPLLTIDMVDPVPVGGSYTVRSRVPRVGDANDGLTGNQLAAAGVDYPPYVFDAGYTRIIEGTVGQHTRAAVREVLSGLPAAQRANPYRVAVAVQEYLRGPRFTYDTDVRDACGPRESVSECLLRQRRGYCQHFASAMVMMLRDQDIPARFVQGYLPGRRVEGGSYEVDRGSLHAWAEVFFPDVGWVRFDPTPGQEERGSEPTDLPEGRPVAERTPIPETSPGPDATEPPGESPTPSVEPTLPPGAAGTGGGPAAGMLEVGIAFGIASLVLLGVAVVAIMRLRRLPGPEPDLAYRGVVSIATRLGRAPRPSQTTYEYVGSLADVVPTVRDELQVVAQARVESVYGGRATEGAALASLRAAYARVRTTLLRLFLRHPRGGA